MHYEFPVIGHLNDVLFAIEGNPAFGVMERGPFIVVNYHYQAHDTFSGPNEPILRECRGLIFDKESKLLLSRRFHKFFNVNEKENLQAHLLPWGNMRTIMEKVDGSMVSPVPVEGRLSNLRWTTKMGITETSMQAEAFVAANPHVTAMCRELLKWGYTPIFEWCSRQNRVVIDHVEDRLVLLAVRNTVSGEYMPYHLLLDTAKPHNVPVVKRYMANEMSLFLEAVKHETDKEGYVIQFDNGHMVKTKTDWYVSIHKAKETLDNPRLVIRAAIEDNLDDLAAALPVADAAKVWAIADEFWKWVDDFDARITRSLKDLRDIRNLSRKDFAIGIAQDIPYAKIYFDCWDSRVTPRESIINLAYSLTGSDKDFNTRFKALQES